MSKEIVFVPMACDLIHEGHINILANASKYGRVVVGLLTDDAISVYKPLPLLNYSRRLKIIKSMKFVDSVVKTTDWDYKKSLENLKPKYVVHGDDWKSNNQRKVRENVLKQIKSWKGTLIEIPYTKGISSTLIKKVLRKNLSPDIIRKETFNRILNSKKLIRVIEVHNGISALIAQKSKYKNKEFDCMWLSSLTHSTSKGKPDIEYIDDTTVNNTINDIFDCSLKPLIFDADSGGRIEHLKFTIKNLERLGVSAIVIEDKVGEKINSLSKNVEKQKQDSIKNFCKKIRIAKNSAVSSNIKIFARIESLIIKKGLDDALLRASEYITSGADGIMIHSNKKTPLEIFKFCKSYNNLKNRVPLIVAPSTYDKTYEKDFEKYGINIVIYANQLIRSAIPSMKKTAEKILKYGRSSEASKDIISINEILKLMDQ
ncbi:MAG: phosphoenolpyruvate mutase [Rickettsiales bacterium]|nr:phosphoenolpyruvate mutase [Rickettsiales bacterium]